MSDNLSRCLSALRALQSMEDDPYWSYASFDAEEIRALRRGKLPHDKDRAILREHGFDTPRDLELAVCDSLGLEYTQDPESGDLKGIRCSQRIYHEILMYIPPSEEDDRMNEAMRYTP